MVEERGNLSVRFRQLLPDELLRERPAKVQV